MNKWEILSFMGGFMAAFFGTVALLVRHYQYEKPAVVEVACFVVGICLLCVWASL